jgi:hypothetical protein
MSQHPASLAISLKALIVSPSSFPPSLPTSGTFSEYSLNLGTAYGEFQISGKTIKSGFGDDLEAARTAARAVMILLALLPVKFPSWIKASRKGRALISIVLLYVVQEEARWVGGLKVGGGFLSNIYELECGARRRVECVSEWNVVEYEYEWRTQV